MTSPVLLDTNVVSELVKPAPNHRVLAFIAAQTQPLLSVLTLHELIWGAERARDTARRAKLLSWVHSIRVRFEGRLIDVNAEIAEHAGRVRASAATQGRVVHAVDALIAASAIAHGAVLATRNRSDFEPLGVSLVDPWRE